MNAAAAVLAAGSSHRLGAPKQLLALPDGSSLVRSSARAVCASRARHRAVVVGAYAEEVSAELADLPLDIISSEDYREGIAASIRAAAAWAERLAADALLLCVCDQPSLRVAHLNALLDAWSADQGLAASRYAGRRAVPAVFPARYFSALQALRGDVGASGILRTADQITLFEWPEGELDVDTPSDWQRLRAGQRGVATS